MMSAQVPTASCSNVLDPNVPLRLLSYPLLLDLATTILLASAISFDRTARIKINEVTV